MKTDKDKQTRISQACTFCARRKIRCNGKYPCDNCITYSQNCMYSTPKKRGRPFRKDMVHKSSSYSKIPVFDLLSPLSAKHSHNVASVDKGWVDKEWSLENFSSFTLSDNTGQSVHWLDIYYKTIHPIVGILPRHIIDRHYYDFPSILYHVMFASCFKDSSNSISVFESHFDLVMNRNRPQQITLYDILIDIHVFMYCYSRNRMDLAMRTLMDVIGAAQSLGLPHIITRTTYLPPPVEHELDARTWIYLHMVDYWSAAKLQLPFVIRDFVPSHMLHFFTHNAYSNDLYPPTTILCFSIHSVPLLEIGKRQLALNAMPVGPEKEAIVRGMMSELDHWRMQLPNLTNPTCLWDLQLLSMFHYIYLMVTKDILISFIESGVQDHYIFHVCKIHAISLHSLLKVTLPRYERFERVPGMFGQALLLGGVFRCALGLWDRNMLSLVNSNIQTLDKLKSPSKSLVNISDKLVKFIKEPRKAMEYLKSM